MSRPLISRLLPNRLKQSLYYRYYRTRHTDWPGLFAIAPLALSPKLAMHGLVPGDVISGCIAFTGFYEWDLSRRIVKLARKGGLFVDVGANMGYFSLLWAGQNKNGRAVAFEAAPRNIEMFKNNIALNGLSDRITLTPKALGKSSGTVPFVTGPADQTGWGGISLRANTSTVQVPIGRLDQEMPNSPIDVLKVDVEGADTWVLLGCEALLRNKLIGTILYEQNKGRMDELGIAAGEAGTFLQDMDYSCVPLFRDKGEWIARPNRKPERDRVY